ncbi:uncharacterized protein ALTATR162_LOCUS11083 [Alternaria atra]|uniref:Bacteriophage T5 Orf172 DNA-binding domain-containing protein n=1 Tax=Alternaria atra TaxID=119953 RepID=A0A8J2IBQ9_9PLEO|nr:uncharacterized protein ALTATR162_LOCUS11083 [Alternaria atra]CAG5184790.1 unnamed protein product [Alternaria atra]
MSMTAMIASILLTPPSSPSPSPRKPVAIPIATAAALQTKLPSQPVKDAQALLQPTSILAVNAISTTNTRSTLQITNTNSLPRTLAALKRALHIDGWQCGAQTLKNTECKRSVINGNKNLIDAQLASMTGLTRASPDIQSALLRLVMLVHCYQHNAGRPKECRLEAWRLAFPSGSADGSAFEVPIEQLIRKALEPFSIKCIAHDNTGPCKGRIGGWKVQNCKRTLQELIKQEIYSDGARLEFLLKVLEWNRTCKTHQSSRRFTWVAAWRESIMAILPLSTPLGDQALTSNAPNKLQTSARAQAGPLIATTLLRTEKRDSLTVQILPSPRAPPVSLDADPALYWPEAYDSSPFDILPHADHNASPTRSHTLICDEIKKSLDARDPRSGCIYAYEVEGNEGYIKIGYTTRPVIERHDEWSFDCNRQTKPLYPSLSQAAATISTAKEATAAPAVLIPHPRRVEALCHAELDHRRIRIYCTACLKQHIEWFQVSTMEATAIIQKWSRWMTTQPYEFRQLRVDSRWELKMSEVRQTSRLDQFMQEIAEAPASP